ncbi:RdRP-domain-containing protein [Saitoella complicata NRRL Y-17804]|uniref:RdRP-domain-containing protein n=1 Tax=Saitoella complicata (strain BCRC 22490 / CBS 7301 / JCM 7358 / NBRC 10748 / NRRL Y-17804) TaxID=698492 RepID=UPI000866C37D|nr:RdRP-domain-containing protein [Saitoella complicata NRRL Y-17804]ODQ55036.1 RdRP-domain-containing protein [Saitoella complicata NRRL Y-17804]
MCKFVKVSRGFQFTKDKLNQLHLWYLTLDFKLAFQCQSLVSDGYILPGEMIEMRRTIERLVDIKGSKVTTPIVESLKTLIPDRNPETSRDLSMGVKEIEEALRRAEENDYTEMSLRLSRFAKWANDRSIAVHHVHITPSGMYLNGPWLDHGNRITRLYSGYEDHFLRVGFTEEDFAKVGYNKGVDPYPILQTRFKEDVLRRGIRVAGRMFEFLAYSSSGLRELSCWFINPFALNDRWIDGDLVRSEIGELETITNAPRYAARMGQAFTSTILSLPIQRYEITVIPDVERCGRVFTDGVGKISWELVKELHAIAHKQMNPSPSLFQIRMAGAKGILALDSTLPGRKICLRKSMIKFIAKPDAECTLEIAGQADHAMKFYLNRQLITLLETLGVPCWNFLALQDRVLEELKSSWADTMQAVSLYHHYGVAGESRLDMTLKILHQLGVKNQLRDAQFLNDCHTVAIHHILRQLKYHGRVLVPDSWTLYGTIDETDTLGEEEIYICLRDGENTTYVEGKVLVARSPAIAPGDVRFATCIGKPPAGSPLEALHNCVVFSQKGFRDMPSMLAGGDLDGDHYHVTKYREIFPKEEIMVAPADYPPVMLKELGRKCTINDVTDFFVRFMQEDKIGGIATAHLIHADRSPEGAKDEICVQLAECHSVAVDFFKSGNPVRDIPPVNTRIKPDFMMQEYRLQTKKADRRRARMGRDRIRFVQSEKTLGRMFRRIDIAFGGFAGRRTCRGRPVEDVGDGSDLGNDCVDVGGGWE